MDELYRVELIHNLVRLPINEEPLELQISRETQKIQERTGLLSGRVHLDKYPDDGVRFNQEEEDL